MTRNPETTSSTSVVARPFITLGRATCGELEPALRREWLVTNGLGGYASGTVAGLNTRRYHGLLVAALAPPVSRTVMVASMIEQVTYGGATTTISTQEFGDGSVVDHGFRHVEYFCLEGTIPVWRYAIQDAVIERRIWMDHGANTTWISYRLLRGTDNAWLTITPLVTYRDFHALTSGEGWAPSLDADEQSVTVTAFEGSTPFSMGADTGAFRTGGDWYWNFRRREETARGLNDHEDLYAVGQFAAELAPGKSLHLRLSSESAPSDDATESLHRERQHALIEVAGSTHSSPEIQQLTLAADQFIVSRSNADGPAGSTIIAGYHWFNDWGRDTMIALPGLTLATGRPDVASEILRTFAGFVSDGLLPNNFPDQSGEIPGYNTADATLWFVLAVRAYFEHTADDQFLDGLYPTLVDIIERHIGGTRYEIGMDKDDFLLHAGEPGVQLTWMDAKVDDWVVTPRIGKPVEINALWYNAVRTVAAIARSRDPALADRLDGIADRIHASFNRRFRSPDLDYLADVVDGPAGDDWTMRPNQI
ncbi:MAG: amylo-alpha-1,6-glucosidase, partial [Chloroflexota bacterium]